jgi:predicted nucleotide-binding protein (sugar kinase/HSP70/actin superfamily)
LDSHSADAGLNTRIEAFFDIVKSYRQIEERYNLNVGRNGFNPLLFKDMVNFIDSDGKPHTIFDSSVKMIVPNMGRYITESVSASFRSSGINSEPRPVYDAEILKLGRGSTLCKECLPLILTSGSLLDYYNNRKNDDEHTLFFMASADGPCRFGQYGVFMKELIKKKQLRNVGIFSLTDENAYKGLSGNFERRSMIALFIADAITEISNAINAIASDRERAKSALEDEWREILIQIESGTEEELYAQLERSAANLSKLEKICDFSEAPKIALVGEIFVRNDEFSRIDLMERLFERNIIVQVAPVNEFVHYVNHIIKLGYTTETYNMKQRFEFMFKRNFLKTMNRKIKRIFSVSGFCDEHYTEIDKIIGSADHLIDPAMTGEAILTVGSALHEILDNVSGVISIGPFGCMPSRVAESILNMEMTFEGKAEASRKESQRFNDNNGALPFLAIETDGNLFPQIIQSKIEIFLLQAERLHRKMMNERKTGNRRLPTSNTIVQS